MQKLASGVPTNFVNSLYNLYYAYQKQSGILWLYYRWMRSPLAVKWLFGMKVLSKEELSAYFTKIPIYFGLATVLLKNLLQDKLHHSPNLKLLEIGVGAFAVLSGCLSRSLTKTIDAIDIDSASVESAKKHIDLNKVNVRVFYSDLFSNIPRCKYDVIFWNLPTTECEPDTYLPRLFQFAPDFMNETSQLLIVYNKKHLPRETVLSILSNYKQLRVNQIKTWWWNVQDGLYLCKS